MWKTRSPGWSSALIWSLTAPFFFSVRQRLPSCFASICRLESRLGRRVAGDRSSPPLSACSLFWWSWPTCYGASRTYTAYLNMKTSSIKSIPNGYSCSKISPASFSWCSMRSSLASTLEWRSLFHSPSACKASQFRSKGNAGCMLSWPWRLCLQPHWQQLSSSKFTTTTVLMHPGCASQCLHSCCRWRSASYSGTWLSSIRKLREFFATQNSCFSTSLHSSAQLVVMS